MHIYSVKELQCLQSTLEMVHAWDSSPQQTDEPCDDADEDLWIFLSVLFSLHLRSPGKRWHRTPGSAQRGWRQVWAGPGQRGTPRTSHPVSLRQHLLTRVPGTEETCGSGTGRENPSGCRSGRAPPAQNHRLIWVGKVLYDHQVQLLSHPWHCSMS